MALQNKKYKVLKPLKYMNPDSPLFRQTINPGDEGSDEVTFPHRSDAEINLLLAKRIIAPAESKPAADKKEGK